METPEQRTALVMGAGGFIGSHMVSRLVSENFFVVGVDLVEPKFEPSKAQVFRIGDCSKQSFIFDLLQDFKFDEIYQFAADMGGAGYIFSGENDFNVMENSAGINIALCGALVERFKGTGSFPRVFYSSSACIYPEDIQKDAEHVDLSEANAYPANPDSDYGWEKLFSERLYMALHRNEGVEVRIGRFHNIYGPLGTWQGGKEKRELLTKNLGTIASQILNLLEHRKPCLRATSKRIEDCGPKKVHALLSRGRNCS